MRERASCPAGRRNRARVRIETDAGEQGLLGAGECGPAGELALQPRADLHGAQVGVAVEVAGIIPGLQVGAEQPEFAVPVGSVRQSPFAVNSG